MAIVIWVVIGCITALLARRIVPEFAQGGFVVTALMGGAGAALGGSFAGFLGGNGATGFNLWSAFVAALGAIVMLLLYEVVARRSI
jgi:uncharacterized membrane protein YeaQ/YmgE (transglycosylase-associated protein family)